MASLSKRHQARNEKALQELIRTVPGNDRCADCQARNPGWASWSMGIFLCMRCAALHRKLGTHISKVKSLSMDTWSTEQVDNMRSVGNILSNTRYNPRNVKPAVPLDVDEVDSAMERYIRQKYDLRTFAQPARVKTSSHALADNANGLDDDEPPPPPPKPGRKFNLGLRAATITPLSAPKEMNESRKASDPHGTASKSRVFGASIGVREDGHEWKLVTLREMGFPDDKRNSNILRGLGGDLERAIESLARLGEGPSPSRSRPSVSQASHNTQNRASPSPFEQQQIQSAPASSMTANNGSSSVTFGLVSTEAPPPAPQQLLHRSNNPFETMPLSAPPQQLEHQMRQLSLSHAAPPAQQLFPNATGGHFNPPDHSQQMRFQQSMTPPVPQTQHNTQYESPFSQHPASNPYYTPTSLDSQQPSPTPVMMQPPSHAPQSSNAPSDHGFAPSNPFGQPYPQSAMPISPLSPLQTQMSQHFAFPQQQRPTMEQPPSHSQSNPPLSNTWMQPPPTSGSYQAPSSPNPFQQQYHHQQQPPPLQQPGQISSPIYPFDGRNQSPYHVNVPFSPNQSQNPSFNPHAPHVPSPLQPQATGRVDKSSILALYNYPQLAPPRSATDISNSAGAGPQSTGSLGPQSSPGKRSVTMPAAGSRNPFLSAAAASSTPASSASHSPLGGSMAFASQHVDSPVHSALSGAHPDARISMAESSDSGRHSPDAFASLSARYLR